jgi:hypothetical protein
MEYHRLSRFERIFSEVGDHANTVTEGRLKDLQKTQLTRQKKTWRVSLKG